MQSVVIHDPPAPHKEVTPVVAASFEGIGSRLLDDDTPSPFRHESVVETELGEGMVVVVYLPRLHDLGWLLARDIAVAQL